MKKLLLKSSIENDKGTWNYRLIASPDTPPPMQLGDIVSVNDKLYIIGGLNGICWEFDLQTGRWEARTPIGGNRSGVRGESHNGLIYAYAGGNGNRFDLFNPSINSWSALPAGPTVGRWHHGSCLIGDNLYIYGGSPNDLYARYSDLWVFNLTTRKWNRLTDCPIAVRHFVMDAWADGFIIHGGDLRRNSSSSQVYYYNAKTDAWMRLSDAHIHINNHAGAVIGDSLYIYGGHSESGAYGDYHRTFVKYDILTGSSETILTLPNGWQSVGHAMIAHKGKIYMYGGHSGSSGSKNTFIEFYRE